MSKSLDGNVAVVTGGTQGIGFAIAEEFVEQGATVVLTGRDQGRLDEAVAKLGPKASGVRADAGSPGAMDALLKDVGSRRKTLRCRTGISSLLLIALCDVSPRACDPAGRVAVTWVTSRTRTFVETTNRCHVNQFNDASPRVLLMCFFPARHARPPTGRLTDPAKTTSAHRANR